jgi:hypothetical protein
LERRISEVGLENGELRSQIEVLEGKLSTEKDKIKEGVKTLKNNEVEISQLIDEKLELKRKIKENEEK